MNTQDIIKLAKKHFSEMDETIFEVLTIAKPATIAEAVYLAKIVSKLSPMVGNLIEFRSVEELNKRSEYKPHGIWKRQDPGFPDTVFESKISPQPGFEIKAWFPLATEITARFKDSQKHFSQDQTYVAMLAWLPEKIIFGRPKILDILVVSGQSVATARDTHYHNPPDYLVIEPEDTSTRTRNLQQTNTAGYKFQDDEKKFAEAKKIVKAWGKSGNKYLHTADYQKKLRELLSKFTYRLDTNFAKMDRIEHLEIEQFKKKVLKRVVEGHTIEEWAKIITSDDEKILATAIEDLVKILARKGS